MADDSAKSRGQLLEEVQELRRQVAALNNRRSTGETEEVITQLRMALSAGRSGSFCLNLSTHSGSWSPELEDLYGMAPGTFGGTQKDWEACVLPEDLPGVLENLRRDLDTGGGASACFRIRRKDTGEIRWIEARSRVICGADGLPAQLFGVHTDITEHKRREQALERANRLYEALQQVNQVIIRAESRDSLFQEVCRALVEYGDFSAAWIGLFAPEGGKVVCAAQYAQDPGFSHQPLSAFENCRSNCSIGRAIHEGCSYVCNDAEREMPPIPCHGRAGSSYWRSLAAFPIDDGASFRGALVLHSTEAGFFSVGEITLLEESAAELSFALNHLRRETLRKQAQESLLLSEERYRLMELNSPDLTLVLSPDGQVEYVSPQSERIVGYPPEEFIGKSSYGHIHPEDRERVRSCIEDSLQGKEIVNFQYRFLARDGSVRWLNHTARPVFQDGVLVKVQACVQDISNAKREEEQREQRIELLRHCNETDSTEALLKTLVGFFQRVTGCEAVGLRICKGADFPYYATVGFDQEFVRVENNICAVFENGEVLRGEDGLPVLECTCGLVLKGRFDPSKPYFTQRGTFWSNNVTALLVKSGGTDDLRIHPRDTCASKGYESVALIPLRSQGKTLGLIQVNDRAKGFLSEAKVAFLEELAGYVAESLGRRLSEDALRDSEDRLELALEGADLGTWDWDVVSGALRFDERWAAMLGYRTTELEANVQQWEKLIHPEDADRVLQATQAHLAGETPVCQVEYRVQHKAGHWVWVLDKGRVLERDSAGAPLRMCGTHLDVTEHKRAEQLLRESEEMMRTVFENSPIAIHIYDKDGVLMKCNRRVAELFATDLDAQIGKFNLRHDPNYQNPEVWARLQRGEAVAHEVEFDFDKAPYPSWKSGKASLHVITTPIPDSISKTIGYILQVTDITEPKRAEHALALDAAIFKNLLEGVVLVGAEDLRVKFVNARFADMFGYVPDELLGQDIAMINARGGGARDEITESVLRRGEWFGEIQNVRKDGRRFWTYASVSVFEHPAYGRVFLTVQTDISNLKQTEQAYRESEERFRQVVENAEEWVWEVDVEGLYTYASPVVETLLGYTPDELVGKKHFYDLFEEGVREGVKEQALQALARREPFRNFENVNRHKHGQSITLSTNGVPIFGENGQWLGYRGSDSDITARKRAEEELRARESLLRAIMDNAPVEIWARDLDEVLFLENPAVVKHWGSLMGKRPEDLVAEPAVLEHWKSNNARAMAGEIVEQENECIIDGVEHVFRNNVAPIRSGDTIIGILGVNVDITELKRAEAALREKSGQLDDTLHATGVGIWYWDVARRHLHADVHTRRILGLGAEAFSGQEEDFYRLVHPSDRHLVLSEIRKTIHAGIPYSTEYRVIWPDESVHHLSVRGRAVRDEQGAIVRVEGVAWDISDRKQLELQLLQSQKMEAVGHLAGGVAHDFNNLLQVILMNTEIALAEDARRVPVRDQLEEVRKASLRATDLTRQLLAFSRRQVMHPVDFDLNELLQGLLKMLRRLLGEHVEIAMLSADGLGTVHADKMQIEQVVMNLCLNARDAMPQGGKITIETRNVSFDSEFCRQHLWAKPGDYVLLGVADTGQGMDSSTLSHIFEPFFTTKELGKGTGLGLATVYGIVKQHSGLIDVWSAPEAGTALRVYLPRVPAEPAVEATAPRQEVRGGTETILVAEDDPAILRSLSIVLGSGGYVVLSATDGYEALRVYLENQERIALVLLDVIMPRLGGKGVMDRIQQLGGTVPFLFSSGYSQDQIDKDFVIQEGLELIEKPYTPEVLLRKVRDILDRKKN